MKAQIRALIDAKMQDLKERNKAREAAREVLSRANKVCRMRRDGKLGTLNEALDILDKEGLITATEELYGITLVYTSCSVVLAYDGEGNLSWNSRHPKRPIEEVQESFEFDLYEYLNELPFDWPNGSGV